MRLSTLVIVVVVVMMAGCSSTGFDGAGPTTTEPEITTTSMDTTTTNRTVTETETKSPVLTTSSGSAEGGQISVYPVENLPDNVTVVNATDYRIRNITIIQHLLREAAQNGDAFQDVNKTQIERLQDELRDVPDSHGRNSEYYIRYQGTVYRLLITVDD